MDAAPDSARSLHEVFASLAGDAAADPGAALAAAGHDGLPAELLSEAVVSYAEVSPPEVAEHLSPVVLGASADPGLALELLSTAPPVTWDDVPEPVVDDVPPAPDDAPDLDFGAGGEDDLGESLDALDAPDDANDALDDVAAVEPAGEPEVPDLPEPGDDDLPTGDLAGEGWDVDPTWDVAPDSDGDLDF